ncbi:MAG: 50S ribosomal protein L11 methyltransferase [bacterium]|nr:50S ribosomal protein L11 methyltransferase [bacterium]
MQNYILCELSCEAAIAEILIAEMGELGFEGFIESDAGFEAYLPENEFNEPLLLDLLVRYEIAPQNLSIRVVPQQNWNQKWEESFEPVSIGNKLRIRAPFHPADPGVELELIIQPKTSFGTGHHETTFTIMELMLKTNMKGKSIFDYGSGTGILAILAAKLGATKLLANDIDSWASENILENIALNQSPIIEFIHGDLQAIAPQKFDYILANINKNILLSSFENLQALLASNGTLFISGFYESDLQDLLDMAAKFGFKLHHKVVKNNWAAAQLILS